MRNPTIWFVLTAILAIGSFVASATIGFFAPLAFTILAVAAALAGIVLSPRRQQEPAYAHRGTDATR